MRRVLIVDDDQRILQLLGHSLKPDLVLLDVMLPGASGIHLLNQIKRIDPTIPVVIMTGSGNTALERQAAESGAAGFIRKPFDLNNLERRVSEIIGTN